MPEQMSQSEFLEISKFLFGDLWAYEISKRLSLNIRNVQRMGSGKRDIPEAVASILRFWKEGAV